MTLVESSSSNEPPFMNITKFDSMLQEELFEFSMSYCKTINLYIYFILCIYRSPLSGPFDFLTQLEALLNKLPLKGSVISTGDLNMNYNGNGRNITDLLINF